MLELDLLKKTKERIHQALGKVPGLIVVASSDELSVGEKVADYYLIVQANGQTFRFIVEVKNQGNPSIIRNAIESLRNLIPDRNAQMLYGVIAVPYISDLGMQLCRDARVGCIDLAGNYCLSFGSVYLESRGNANPSPVKPKLSLFSPKSSRISRVLLCNVPRLWQVQQLAEVANVSIGLASSVKDMLIEEGFLVEDGRLLKLAEPARLADAWLQTYSYRKNRIREYYSPVEPRSVEFAVQENCSSRNVRSALGLFSGAALVAPHVRMNKAFIYVESGVDEIITTLDLKPVSSGSNVMLLEPYDEGVFYRSQQIGKDTVVSNIQLYVDLKKYKGRGEEAAEFLRQVKLQREWGLT